VTPATSTATKLAEVHPSTYSSLKRLLDIAGSLLGLLFVALIFIPVAIAIKLDSPGPVFYVQERCGLQGRPFRMWKFRSMVSNAESLKSNVQNQAQGLVFKNQNDPRVTRVGSFLRKSSVDEFPQFWNVLKGEMSLVGTRPPTLNEVERYSPRHWQRLNVKPGMTGEWQVNGRSTVRDFEKIVDLDLRYQQRWHPLYDVEILLKTVYVILAKVGAY